MFLLEIQGSQYLSWKAEGRCDNGTSDIQRSAQWPTRPVRTFWFHKRLLLGTIKTMGVNRTAIIYLRMFIIQIRSIILSMGVEPESKPKVMDLLLIRARSKRCICRQPEETDRQLGVVRQGTFVGPGPIAEASPGFLEVDPQVHSRNPG